MFDFWSYFTDSSQAELLKSNPFTQSPCPLCHLPKSILLQQALATLPLLEAKQDCKSFNIPGYSQGDTIYFCCSSQQSTASISVACHSPCTPFGQIIATYFCLWLFTLQLENTLCIFDKHLEFYWVKNKLPNKTNQKPQSNRKLLKRACCDSLSDLQNVNYQSQEINVTWHLQCSETEFQKAWFTEE